MSDTTVGGPGGPASHAFLKGGGELAHLIAAYDWQATPLGPIDGWPPSLKAATALMLRSKVPMVMLWGHDGIMLYNDSYADFAAGRHPQLLGSKVREGWHEVADFNDHVLRTCLAGGTLHYKDRELTLNRHGHAAQVWTDLDYSPVLDESGEPAGVLAIVIDTSLRVVAERARARSEERLRTYIAASSDVLYSVNADWSQMQQIDGRSFIADMDAPSTDWMNRYIDPADQPRLQDAIQNAIRTKGVFELEHRVRRANGSLGWTFSRAVPILDENGEITGWFGAAVDVTDRTRREVLERAQSDVLERVIQEHPLSESLSAIVRTVEEYSSGGMRASVLIVDDSGQHLRLGAAPSLAPAYNRAIDGIDIGEGQGSCGTAAFRKERVLVADIDADPLWKNFRTLAQKYGLRACWSVPIVSKDREILGTFAMYYPEPRAPNEEDMALVDFAVRSASLAIGHMRATDTLRRVTDTLRRSRDQLAEESRALEILNTSGAGIAAQLNLEELVQMVVDAGVQLTDAQFGAFFFNDVNEVGARYRLYALSGADRKDFETLGTPRLTGLFDPTFKGERIIRSGDITMDHAYGGNAPHFGIPKGHLPVRSYLAVPVIGRSGEVIGALLFGHSEPNRFTERAERLIGGLAGQAATGIDNARLVEQIRRYNTALEQRVSERTAELNHANEALRQAQKMEAVGQLTGGIAHDFNNMLAVIVGSLDLLKRRVGPGDPRALRYITAAADGAKRAALLTQRLLAFSRRQPLSPEPLDVNALVAGMSDLLRHSLGAEVQLETVLGGGVWRIHVDRNQLENTILNLAVNARDAMPDGGRLTVETQNAYLDERYAANQLGVTQGQYVLIAVTDTGSGMSEQTIAKAFDPFFTTKEIGKGTGLGLSQVYGFVKQSGGHVKIYSELDHGTTLKLYLPRFTGALPQIEHTERPEATQRGDQHELILVVEDEPAVRQFSVDALEAVGYSVVAADGAARALQLLDENPDIALVFTDVVMPEINGAKLGAEVHRRRPDVKLLFTTGFTQNAVVHNGILDPGVHLISKPFGIDALAAKVRQVLDS